MKTIEVKTLEGIGDLIIERRATLGISQTQLARMASIDQGHLSRIEAGRRLPSMSLLTKIMQLLDVDLLLSLEGTQTNGTSSQQDQ